MKLFLSILSLIFVANVAVAFDFPKGIHVATFKRMPDSQTRAHLRGSGVEISDPMGNMQWVIYVPIAVTVPDGSFDNEVTKLDEFRLSTKIQIPLFKCIPSFSDGENGRMKVSISFFELVNNGAELVMGKFDARVIEESETGFPNHPTKMNMSILKKDFIDIAAMDEVKLIYWAAGYMPNPSDPCDGK